jgi:hypothetical protein
MPSGAEGIILVERGLRSACFGGSENEPLPTTAKLRKALPYSKLPYNGSGTFERKEVPHRRVKTRILWAGEARSAMFAFVFPSTKC